MSLITPILPQTSPNMAASYVMPGKTTYFPDGSYSVEKASFYSQQQPLPSLSSNDNFAFSPVMIAPAQSSSQSRGKRALNNAFNPQELGRDVALGGIASVVWTGLDKFFLRTSRISTVSTPRLFLVNLLWATSMFLGFGILSRAFLGDRRRY